MGVVRNGIMAKSMTQKTKHSQWVRLKKTKKKKQKYYDVAYVLKPTKVKIKNK